MKNRWSVFFGFTFVLIFTKSSHAELNLLLDAPSATPSSVMMPEAGPTLIPGIMPSPTFRVFYDPPTVPTPSPSPLPTVQPAPIISTSPAPLVTPVFTPLVLLPTIAPETKPLVSPPVIAPTPVPAAPLVAPVAAPVVVRPKLLPPITVSIFGGGDLISFSEVNQLVGTELFKSMIYYGGEVRYPFFQDFSLLLRVERMSRSSAVGAAAFSLSSIPVMAGLDFHSSHQRKLRFHVSALVGPALNTNLTETASSLPSPNVTQFSSTALSEMIRLSLEYPLSHTVGIFVEGGYRLLKTSSAGPTQTGSGGTIFQSNGQYQSVPLNLSGPFLVAVLFSFFNYFSQTGSLRHAR